jgi:hypothetical protein
MAVLDAESTQTDLYEIRRISEFCRIVFGSMARSDQRRWAELYVRGLIILPGRKSIRSIAKLGSGDDSIQSLQQFVNQSPWAWGPVRRALAKQVSQALRPKAWVVQEVAFPKNGDGSVAVARQYAPSEGRILNCQRALGIFLAGDEGSSPVNWRLVIPRSWDRETTLRSKTGVPQFEHAQPDWQYLLNALDEMVGDWGLPPAPVIVRLDNERDVHPLLHGLEQRRLSYLVEVPPATPVALSGAAEQPPTVGKLATLAAKHGQLTLGWREGPAGELVRSRYVSTAVPGFSVVGGIRPGGAPRYSRHVLAEWHHGRPETGAVWLTDLGAGDAAELTSLLRPRPRLAPGDEDLTERAGLRHFEGRSFRGWHHHVTLASVAHGYRLVSRISRRVPDQALRMSA